MHPFLFIGLGNPGRQYEMTRHNLGYLVVQEFAKKLDLSLQEDRRFNALVAKGLVENQMIHLLLPKTYMNLSGVAVRRYIDYFKLHLDRLLVIVDDIALPFGQLRLKTSGSAGGHNGLKSIELHLGTSRYMRLRMGIGHPGEKVMADYVLDSFSSSEQQELKPFLERAITVMEGLLNESPARIMNKINKTPGQG